MSKVAKVITLFLVFAVIVFSVVFGVVAAKKISKMPIGELAVIDSLDVEDEQVGMINFLIIGIDEEGTRSDTIMLLSYDGYSNRANILSLHRDTQVVMEGYKQKLNAAIGVGQKKVEEGIDEEPEEELIHQVKNLTGLPVHYFMTINFDAFIEIIDALDGVEFDVPYDMDYDDPVQNLHIHLEAGQQHLDGEDAHDFVRFRHNNDGSAPGEYIYGDVGRIHWQQEFVKELLAQKLTAEYFDKVSDVVDVIRKNVKRNCTVQDLVKHSNILQNIDVNEIESYELPGEAKYVEEDRLWWYICDEAKTMELVDDVFMPKSAEEWEAQKAEMEKESSEKADEEMVE